MSRDPADGLAHSRLDPPGGPGVQEGDVLLPRDARHHHEAVLMSQIEQPALGGAVETNRVDAAGRHLCEVARDRVRLEATGRLGAERTVGDALDPQLLPSQIQRLAPHAGARGRLTGDLGLGGRHLRSAARCALKNAPEAQRLEDEAILTEAGPAQSPWKTRPRGPAGAPARAQIGGPAPAPRSGLSPCGRGTFAIWSSGACPARSVI